MGTTESHRNASFKHRYDYICNDEFFDRNLTIFHHRLIFSSGSRFDEYSESWDYTTIFGGFSYETF